MVGRPSFIFTWVAIALVGAAAWATWGMAGLLAYLSGIFLGIASEQVSWPGRKDSGFDFDQIENKRIAASLSGQRQMSRSVTEIIESLQAVYSPEGVGIFLVNPNRLLGGKAPLDLIRDGRTQEVAAAVEKLTGEAVLPSWSPANRREYLEQSLYRDVRETQEAEERISQALEAVDRIDSADHRLNDGRRIDGKIVMGGTEIQDDCQIIRAALRGVLQPVRLEPSTGDDSSLDEACSCATRQIGRSPLHDPGCPRYLPDALSDEGIAHAREQADRFKRNQERGRRG